MPIDGTSADSRETLQLLYQYGFGPVNLTGTDDTFYDRHLLFDHVLDTADAGARERFEAFGRNEPSIFAPLHETLLAHGDYYMHLADPSSYLEADARLCELYADPEGWAHKAILNVASSGKFSSDRTIAEYAADIRRVEPRPVA